MTKEKLLNLTLNELKAIFRVLPTSNTPHRFGYKNFWYGDYYYIPDYDIHVRIGQSYSTIVTIEVSAFVGGELYGVLYEIGKWSTTTSKQVTQFYNQISNANARLLIELK